jgi:hypothetical protein
MTTPNNKHRHRSISVSRAKFAQIVAVAVAREVTYGQLVEEALDRAEAERRQEAR